MSANSAIKSASLLTLFPLVLLLLLLLFATAIEWNETATCREHRRNDSEDSIGTAELQTGTIDWTLGSDVFLYFLSLNGDHQCFHVDNISRLEAWNCHCFHVAIIDSREPSSLDNQDGVALDFSLIYFTIE